MPGIRNPQLGIQNQSRLSRLPYTGSTFVSVPGKKYPSTTGQKDKTCSFGYIWICASIISWNVFFFAHSLSEDSSHPSNWAKRLETKSVINTTSLSVPKFISCLASGCYEAQGQHSRIVWVEKGMGVPPKPSIALLVPQMDTAHLQPSHSLTLFPIAKQTLLKTLQSEVVTD